MPPDHQDNNSFLTKIKNLFIDLKNNLSLSKSLKILGIIILLVGLPAGLYLVQQTQIFKPKADAPKDQIDLLTEQLLQADQKYDILVSQTVIPSASPSAIPIPTPTFQPVSTSSATPQATSSVVRTETTSKEAQDQLNTMKGISIRRKELLLQKIKDNPQEFLDKATLADKVDTFPESVRPYIEEKIQAQGKLTVVHIDDFENKKSRYEYFLEKGSDKRDQNRYKLYFVKNPPQVLSGSEVKVKGVELEQQVALSTGNAQPNQEGLQIIAAAILPPAIGEQKTAVILVNFSDDPNNKPITKEDTRNFVFANTNPGSINNYYKENSYNKMGVSGDVYGWYTINYSQCNYFDYVFRIADLVNEVFTQETGLLISNQYKRVMYILPTDYCGSSFSGFGTIGGRPISQAWVYWSRVGQNIAIYVHELGHNLGIHHANSWVCQLGIYTDCTEYEYGEKYDVMGGDGGNPLKMPTLQFNAPHKKSVGWLGEEQTLKNVTKDGIYTIGPLEVNNTNTKVLRIRKPDTNEYYFISYRQRIGFDSYSLDFEVTNGASIHIWSEDPFRQTKYIKAGIYTNNYDLALADGKVFHDSVNDISIKQISHTISTPTQEGSVTVEVKFKGGILPIPTSPPDYRRVFITSLEFNGNFEGRVELADAKCYNLANNKALGGEWKAWISDSLVSPESRFVKHNSPYKLLNGITIARDWTDLVDGSLQNPINIDENGNTKPPDSYIWTATHSLGFKTQPNCNNWTSDSSQGIVGNTEYKDFRWTQETNRLCRLYASLYCFEQTPLPSPTPTPKPVFVCNACAADMNKDGVVNILDFSILAACFNKLATDTSRGVACNKADVNNDGAITILDFNCFAIKFNLQCLLGQEKGNSAGLDPETRRLLQAQLLKESDTPPPPSSQTIQPSQGERPAAQGTVEPPRSTNLATTAVNLITNAVQGQKRISKAVTKITLLRRSNNQETDFLSTIDLTGLDWGDNFFVMKRYFSDGTAEEVANSSFKITVVPKCQETARDLGQGVAQNFFICEDGSEKPNGDKYCINGNPDPNNCQQTSQPDQFSEQPATSQESEQSFSQDNGDGTYTETKDGISKQYRFSDHAEVLGKCRDTDRNNNVIVKVESGRDRVDINCEDLGQRCEEYLNEEGKQDARCIE